MKYFITGGCGFLGSNLACEVLKRGDELVIFDNLYRAGSEKNLEWLKTQGEFIFYKSDIRNRDDVHHAIKKELPDVIFHVAGQVAMTTSLENPRLDFEINVHGTFNVLEAIKEYCPDTIVTYSSTNKVYGDLEELTYVETDTRYNIAEYKNGLPENLGLDFRTPYGCSKGAADQYMKEWAHCYGLKTITFRHSSIYGTRQFPTFDQGWIGWFIDRALQTKLGKLNEPFSINGDGKQVRDFLFSSDLVNCYFSAVAYIEKTKGQSFNIGGGMKNSLSLLELFAILEEELEIKLNFVKLPARNSDQRVFVADISKAQDLYQWSPQIEKRTGIRNMIDWMRTI